MALVAGSSNAAVTNRWPTANPLIATSLKPNLSWMHRRMTLNDRTTAPSVAVWRSVCTSSLPVYHSFGGQMRKGERKADSASQMLRHELKGPSMVHRKPIYSFIISRRRQAGMCFSTCYFQPLFGCSHAGFPEWAVHRCRYTIQISSRWECFQPPAAPSIDQSLNWHCVWASVCRWCRSTESLTRGPPR